MSDPVGQIRQSGSECGNGGGSGSGNGNGNGNGNGDGNGTSGNGSCGCLRASPSDAILRSEFECLLSESSDDEETPNAVNAAAEPEPGAIAGSSNSGVPRAISEESTEVILAMIWRNNRWLGAVCYDLATSGLHAMEDTCDDPVHFDVTKALFRQWKPRYVVMLAGSPAAFANTVKRMIATERDGEQPSSSSNSNSSGLFASGDATASSTAVLRLVGKKEHSFERCSRRVGCLRLASEPTEASSADRLTFLNSILNFNCAAMIHALGVLLLFVDKHWNAMALDPSGKPTYLSLEHMALENLMMMNDDAYRALNIVRSRDHPSLFKFGEATTKTGTASLFSLYKRYCRSGPGAQFLWKTMQHPSRDVDLLRRRLNAVEFLLSPNNQTLVENLSSCLNHVDRLTIGVLAHGSGPRAKPSNWYKLYKTVSHAIRIADLCEEHAKSVEIFGSVADTATNEIRYVKYFIEYIVDFVESRREGKLVVKPNVDPLLDELNHARRTLPELLTRMAEKDMREHLPASVTGCNMVYLPNIGYVLAINKWNPTPPDELDIPNLDFKFSVKDVHYYKSISARELDETVGDVILKIAIRQNRIVQKLSRYAAKHAHSIVRAIERCAELDTLIAFARVARDYDYARPTITRSKIIDAKETRHPLFEFSTACVPNDVRSGNGGSLIKVLTGPNSCGKSVYLKQIGLLIFMAHIGSYVAAKSATIGTVVRLSTQMSNTESIGLNASSFLQNLRQINVAIRASTSDSVVLMDELERGTTESSGSSLVAAVLDEFAKRGQQCPHVFAATHAHAVTGMLQQTASIELQTFEYVVDQDQSLAFLYRLISGSVSRSFAHFAAKFAELDESIVQRSLQVYESIRNNALPSRIGRRRDILHRIAEICETRHDAIPKQLKSLIDAIMTSK